MEAGNLHEISANLSLFKESGLVQFNKVLLIPSQERITALCKDYQTRMRVSAVLCASIKSAMGSINLRVGLTEDQIFHIAEAIIDQSEEDNLALEDVLLFLQQLVTGQAGKIYDRMDIPTFFELFENYRQDRHDALKNIQYERDANYKVLGPTERMSEDKGTEKDLMRSAISEHLKNIYSKPPENV